MGKRKSREEEAYDEWIESLSKLEKTELVKGNSRLRSEYVTYAVKGDGMIVGYFIPSIAVGIIYDKPVQKDPYVKFKKGY